MNPASVQTAQQHVGSATARSAFRVPHSEFHARAFTLVEILVVVAIIVALLAVLLPAMGPALSYAETTKCQTQMRSIAQACLVYASDSFGGLPQPNWLSVEDGPGEWTGAGWLYKYPNRSVIKDVEAGALWPLLKTYDVYHCPSHAQPWGDGGRTTEALTSYNMNGSVCGYGANSQGMYRVGDYRGDDIIFWEQDENGGSWNDGSNTPNELITPRHTRAGRVGAGNVSMIDGTVQWIPLSEYNAYALPANPAIRNRMWNRPYSPTGW